MVCCWANFTFTWRKTGGPVQGLSLLPPECVLCILLMFPDRADGVRHLTRIRHLPSAAWNLALGHRHPRFEEWHFPRGRRGTVCSPVSVVKFKNAWRFTSTFLYIFLAWCEIKVRWEINNVEDHLEATITIYWYSNRLNVFRAIFCPSSGVQDCVLQRVV